MASVYEKDDMFTDFFLNAKEAAGAWESLFGITSICEQVFGEGRDESGQERRLRASPAWATLSRLYDYALLGQSGGRDPHDIVIDGAGVLALVTTENHSPEERWEKIVAMGDARYALDAGDPVELGRIALLAQVDVRTVRNAVSSGELLATKEAGLQFADNVSARRWLSGRRGFRPTEVQDQAVTVAVGSVTTPAGFAALLAGQRKLLGMEQADAKLTVLHPAASPAALAQLEAGVFSLPLDVVFPLADFYQLPRSDFLACVMRVFFRDELDTIVGHARDGGAR